MKNRMLLLYIGMIILLTGCKATYNLEISQSGMKENLVIYATTISENSTIKNYPLVAYITENVNDDYSNDLNILFEKIDGIDYYNDSISLDDQGFTTIKYKYNFDYDKFLDSSIINGSYDKIVLNKYDSNDDGKDDYTVFSTMGNFIPFERYNTLENVTIKITCLFKMISHNADKVDGNTYIWNFTKDNVKDINLVYDTNSVIDKRNFFEKNSMFTFFVGVILIFGIIYFIIKRISLNKNKI